MFFRNRALIPGFVLLLSAFYATVVLEGRQQDSMLSDTDSRGIPIAVGGGETGNLLREWYAEGTAAGNLGDYYDNRDKGHSGLNMTPYPQLRKIEYTEAQKKARKNYALQTVILPHVVFGNSSTSGPPEKGGSNPRNYYTQRGGLQFLFTQYTHNNLYIYPEHRDYDPGRNGLGGYGDLYPTNTPYLIISQGSSGSDQPFMRALPYVLAAFRPEVKKRLTESGLLMPTVQMLLRIAGKRLQSPGEYLTGKAHPTVFQGRDLDVLKMVEMAHAITSGTIPPISLIKVLKEDRPVSGIDYFEPPDRTENLADTPAVIARIFRGSSYTRTMTVSAEGSRDLNQRSLEYHWVVLRGDPDRIRIEYLNSSRSVAEITVPYHERFPIGEGSALESNRVDIGVFVHNGVYYSPPAFITFYFLDTECRTYRADGRPLEIAYGAGMSTVEVADWAGLFDIVESGGSSWPARLLNSHFTSKEVSALKEVSREFREAHSVTLLDERVLDKADAALRKAKDAVAAQTGVKTAAERNYRNERNENTAAAFEGALKTLDETSKVRDRADSDYRAARSAVEKSKTAEKQILERSLPSLGGSAATLVQNALDALLTDAGLCLGNPDMLDAAYRSAGADCREAFDKVFQVLVRFGVAGSFNGFPIRLKPVRAGEASMEERLTRFEKEMVERLNAVVLSRILFPGILKGDWRENYVDSRIASAKEWRDVYRYRPDGSSDGWLRYEDDGIREFSAEGLLVEERDSQGRCTRGRVVRYEREASKSNSGGGSTGKVVMVPTGILRECGDN